MKAVSPSRRMISPINRSLPTRTISYIRAPVIPLAMTAGPAILMISPVMATNLLPLPQLNVDPDVLFDQARNVVLAALDLRRGGGERNQDGQIPPAHGPRQVLVEAFQQ